MNGKMDDRISVIIPVYNVEKYLRECVDSVLTQTYTNLEIILIDDGSTDCSGEICDEYAGMDCRIRVIHQKNGGLSAARNTGLDVCTGQYISFVDSDDVVGAHFLETLYSALKAEHAQIAACNFQRYLDGQDYGAEVPEKSRTCLSQKEAIWKLVRYDAETELGFMPVAWNKLYECSLFREVRYPVGKIHEDEFVIVPLLMQIQKMVKCEGTFYFYRQRSDSITGQEQQKNPRHLEVLEAYRTRCELLKGKEYQQLYPDMVTHYFDAMCYNAFLIAKPCGQFRQLYCRYVQDLLKYWKWVQGKRYFLFAFSPTIYYQRHWK